MSKSTDEQGRIYLPKDVRERFGDRYRIVELPSHVALFPVDEDPLEAPRRRWRCLRRDGCRRTESGCTRGDLSRDSSGSERPVAGR
nr:AbrB/MazE/SpoVT family DNA-binding domain-containing protein [Halostagnicola kamekurae]